MHSLSILIKNKAKELGFDACGIAEVASADTEALFFDRWIAEGCHAGMKYMENYRDIRLDPAGLVEGARSVISVALNYYPPQKQFPGPSPAFPILRINLPSGVNWNRLTKSQTNR